MPNNNPKRVKAFTDNLKAQNHKQDAFIGTTSAAYLYKYMPLIIAVREIIYDGSNPIVKKANDIIQSSTRPMPARFCGGNFMLQSNLLTSEDQYELAGNAILALTMVKDQEFQDKIVDDDNARAKAVLVGETIELAVALTYRLGGTEADEKEITNFIIYYCNLQAKVDNQLAEVLKLSTQYFIYCRNFAWNRVHREIIPEETVG